MSASGPTLAELRARVQKDRHREIGNWLARRVARPTAVYGSWLAIRLGLSAHQVTLLALLSSLGGRCRNRNRRSAPGSSSASRWLTWASGSTTSTARSPAGAARSAWTASTSTT